MFLSLIFLKIFASFVVSDVQINPGVLIEQNYYPSGNKDADKIYSSDRPSTKFPLLKLDTKVYDPQYNFLEAGIYSVRYVPEYKVLIIGDNDNQVKAPVFQVIDQTYTPAAKKKKKRNAPPEKPYYISSAEVAFISENKVFIIYRNEGFEVHGYLYLPEEVLNGR